MMAPPTDFSSIALHGGAVVAALSALVLGPSVSGLTPPLVCGVGLSLHVLLGPRGGVPIRWQMVRASQRRPFAHVLGGWLCTRSLSRTRTTLRFAARRYDTSLTHTPLHTRLYTHRCTTAHTPTPPHTSPHLLPLPPTPTTGNHTDNQPPPHNTQQQHTPHRFPATSLASPPPSHTLTRAFLSACSVSPSTPSSRYPPSPASPAASASVSSTTNSRTSTTARYLRRMRTRRRRGRTAGVNCTADAAPSSVACFTPRRRTRRPPGISTKTVGN